MSNEFPNLAGIATNDLVEKITGGNFAASYINWSRTMHLLRTHAPGWLPELMPAENGSILHESPKGGYLMIRFRHADGRTTPAVPQAVMDSRNAAILTGSITARDITDTHRRGVCMAAALTFGLAYELWAKMPLESGYGDHPEPVKPDARKPTGQPTDGVWDALDAPTQAGLLKLAATVRDFMENGDPEGAYARIERDKLGADEKSGLWTLLDSKTRSALKKVAQTTTNGAAAH